MLGFALLGLGGLGGGGAMGCCDIDSVAFHGSPLLALVGFGRHRDAAVESIVPSSSSS